MKNLVYKALFDRGAQLNGILALFVFAVVGVGCGDANSVGKQEGGNSGSSSPVNGAAGTSGETASGSTASESAPPDEEVVRLARETTAKFGNAVNSADFSLIHGGASEDFQKTYTVEQMSDAFKSYTDQKAVVAPILERVGSAEVEFTRSPSIRSEKGLKILVASGKFATKPHTVRFDYEYVNRDDQWKLLKLVVNIP